MKRSIVQLLVLLGKRISMLLTPFLPYLQFIVNNGNIWTDGSTRRSRYRSRTSLQKIEKEVNNEKLITLLVFFPIIIFICHIRLFYSVLLHKIRMWQW